MDRTLLEQAEKLLEISQFLKDKAMQTRRLPEHWQIGQKVIPVDENIFWEKFKGKVFTIVDIEDRYKYLPATEYQLIWAECEGHRFYMTSNEIELA